VGRDREMEEVKRILQLRDPDWKVEPWLLAAVHGKPGMGKTALVTAVARNPEICAEFPDGVYWCHLATAMRNSERALKSAEHSGTDNPTTRMHELVKCLRDLAERQRQEK
jgi:hypothetical protein